MWLSNPTVVSGLDEVENNWLDLRYLKSFKRVPGDFFYYFVLYQKVTTLVLELKVPRDTEPLVLRVCW